MPDSTTPNLALIKPEIGGSIDTWGEKLNADMDILDTQVAARAKKDGTQPFTGRQTFADTGIQIGNFVIQVVGGVLKITNGAATCATITSAGIITGKDVVSNPSLT
jgi:hypothetical protein